MPILNHIFFKNKFKNKKLKKKKKNDGNTDARAFSDIWRPHNSKFPLKVTKMRQSKTTF